MSFELVAKTEAGRRWHESAQSLIPQLRTAGAIADRTGTMSEESFKALHKTGISAAFVPEDLGGYGLNSIHDWLVGIATLARGDGSVAIAINMHLGVSRGLSQAFTAAKDRKRDTEALAKPLQAITAGKMLICATATERGTDNLHPFTEATPVEDGWSINGQKMFVTMSPLATHLGMNLRMRDDSGDHLVTTMVPINAPGIHFQNDWDALGMRGSGSQSVVFENLQIPQQSLRKLGPWGTWSVPVLINRTLGNLPLVAAFLGIAEHAYEIAIETLTNKLQKEPESQVHPGVIHLVAEMEMELARCQAILQRAGDNADQFLDAHSDQPPTMAAAHELMKDYQCAKSTVNQGAIEIVSKAMDLAGGGGYLASNRLSQLYRDVRAGPFMQPFSTTEMRTYIGSVALGVYPD